MLSCLITIIRTGRLLAPHQIHRTLPVSGICLLPSHPGEAGNLLPGGTMDKREQTAATHEVGRKLVDLCRKGKNVEAVNTLYSPDVVSIEIHGDATMPERMQGIDAIRKKNQWWIDNHTIHSASADGP